MNLEIIGSPQSGKEWEAAIILQGTYEHEYTKLVIERFVVLNPNVLIICSTYKMEDNFLSESERALVDAGNLVFLLITEPSQDRWPHFWETNHANQNLQRLSSYIGLEYARMLGIQYSLKIRSDTFLGRHNVIRYFKEQLEEFPVKPREEPAKTKSRIIVSGQGTISNPAFWAPFHVRDHWYFGHTDDLVKFFDITSKSTWGEGTGIAISCPESAMTCVWMIDQGIEAEDIRELLGRYFIVENAADIEQVRVTQTPYWQMDYERYKSEGISYLREIYATADSPGHTTTREEWLQMEKCV